MFDDHGSPEGLLDSVEKFLRLWHGQPRPWYGIAEEKLRRVSLPEPLRRFYGIAGEWPGENFWRSAFAFQDRLTPFELLEADDGKLTFLVENQGVWTCGVDAVGRDPEVWLRLDDGPWQPLGCSLSRILATVCLHESLFGCKRIGSRPGCLERLRSTGRRVSPLYLGAPYVRGTALGYVDFHLIDGRLLVMDDDWIGTNSVERLEGLDDLFDPLDPPRTVEELLGPEGPMPHFIRRNFLVNAAKMLQVQVDHLSGKIDAYLRAAETAEKAGKPRHSDGEA